MAPRAKIKDGGATPTETISPFSVRYKVASNPGDYAAAHRLLQSLNLDIRQHVSHKRSLIRLTFPTIMAWEVDQLVGILGTRIHDEMIVAGPLALLQDRRRTMTAIRLCEAYISAMRAMGIETFILGTKEGDFIHRGIQRVHPLLRPYKAEGDRLFYVWRTDNFLMEREEHL